LLLPGPATSFYLRINVRFDKEVQRILFGPKGDVVIGQWGKLQYEELTDLCSSQNIIRVIKSRRTRWAEHVTRIGDRRGAYRGLGGNLRERGHLENLNVGGRIILKWIFRKWNRGMDWMDLAQDRDRWRALVKEVTKLWFP